MYFTGKVPKTFKSAQLKNLAHVLKMKQQQKKHSYKPPNHTIRDISKTFLHNQLFLFITAIEGHVHYSQVTH